MFDENAVLDGLNEQQRRGATQHRGRPPGAAPARPGRVVARGAWRQGSKGVPASRILLLTFTRRAASDMLARAAAWFDGSSQGIQGPGRICGGGFAAIG